MASKPGIELSAAQRAILVEARALLGLTRAKVAKACGVSVSAIVNYENGTSNASAGVLEKWAGCLEYRVDKRELEIVPVEGPGKGKV